jgi:long-chain acyl-CoA synthetase
MLRYTNHMATELSAQESAFKTTQAGRTALAIARLSRQAELAMAEVELTLSQYRVLAVLAQGCEASSKLAEKLAVSRPSVTGVVDGLVVRGLVRRNQDGHDRRRIDLDLTDAGCELLLAAEAAIERRMDRIDALIQELRG